MCVWSGSVVLYRILKVRFALSPTLPNSSSQNHLREETMPLTPWKDNSSPLPGPLQQRQRQVGSESLLLSLRCFLSGALSCGS